MKSTKYRFLAGLLSMSLLCVGQARERYVITSWSKKAGLFALFFSTLNHLMWAESADVAILPYWDERCAYFDPEWQDEYPNAWDYYFYPVSLATVQEGDIQHGHFCAPSNTNGTAHPGGPNNLTVFRPDHRKRAHACIQKYITFKESVVEKVQEFYQENIQGIPTIAIHLRGTDKITETPAVPVETILAQANKYVGYQFFVATDEERLLEKAQEILQGPVLYYDSHRSRDGKQVHYRKKVSNAELGQEVLVETLLLSQCDRLIHTISNVSIAALFFNPRLKHTLLVQNKDQTKIIEG